MNPMDFINITTISLFLIIIGAIGIILLKKPIDKIIMFNVLNGGFFITLVSSRYLDLAFAAAIFDPIATVIFLMTIVKLNESRKLRLNSGDIND